MESQELDKSLLGNSTPIVELKKVILQVAPTDVTVLITGESGVGKEVVAHQIHNHSKRKLRPYVTVNCGAIPEGIIESELFGHVRGSFTGASETRKGYFEMANGGTIFLDEIAELSTPMQVKFLRVLETGEYNKVGNSKTEMTDVRILAATNKILEQEIASNNFREDLYYRLRSINICIPPLRERREDVSLLFNHFIKSFCERNYIEFKGIDDDALNYLVNYSWPGNIRQLKNFAESIVILNKDRKISIDDVLKNLNIPSSNILPAYKNQFRDTDEKQILLRALFELKTDILEVKQEIVELKNGSVKEIRGLVIEDEKLENLDFEGIEQEVLTYFWKKYNGNINKIANKLNISSRTLYRKYNEYGLKNNRNVYKN